MPTLGTSGHACLSPFFPVFTAKGAKIREKRTELLIFAGTSAFSVEQGSRWLADGNFHNGLVSCKPQPHSIISASRLRALVLRVCRGRFCPLLARRKISRKNRRTLLTLFGGFFLVKDRPFLYRKNRQRGLVETDKPAEIGLVWRQQSLEWA
jgi:hypothetical protein